MLIYRQERWTKESSEEQRKEKRKTEGNNMNTNVASKGGVGFALVALLAAASVVLTAMSGIF